MTFADMALPYVSVYGLAVFPVGRNKAPCEAGGCHGASRMLDQIDAWSDRYPRANVAIATGPDNNLVVLDVDHPRGTESLERLLAAGFDPLPRTIEVKTGGGGRHFYFAHPFGKIRNRAGHIAPGLDIRAGGGSVIAPPSVHASGKRYEWIVPPDEWVREGAVYAPPMPEWLRLKVIHDRPPRRLADRPVRQSRGGNKILDLEEGRLRQASHGTRNDALNRAAYVFGQFVAGGEINQREAEIRLSAAAMAVGLGAGEIAATLRSGLSAGLSNPRETFLKAHQQKAGEGAG